MHQIRLPPEEDLKYAADDIQAHNFGMLCHAHVYGLHPSAKAEALAEAQDCFLRVKVVLQSTHTHHLLQSMERCRSGMAFAEAAPATG